MEFLIFSDSHGRVDAMREVIARQIRAPHAILFAGDGVRDTEQIGGDVHWSAVSGNCDFFCRDYPETLLLPMGGHRVLLTHGHRFGVKEGLERLMRYATVADADVVIYGHTHLPHLQVLESGTVLGERTLERPMYLFNPGSIGMGSHSFGTLTLRPDLVFFAHGEL